MRTSILIGVGLVALLCFQTGHLLAADAHKDDASISGSEIEGYRVLPIPITRQEIRLKVYRGDYVKFKIDAAIANRVLSIPQLAIEEEIPVDIADAPHFKMKTTGTFAFSLAEAHGTIEVVACRGGTVKEVTPAEAARLINNVDPIILDVRTTREYRSARLKDAVHIPVQELRSRLKELTPHKQERVLVYCRIGSRSTDAARILIDNGFERVYNLRRGIVSWYREKRPLVYGR